VGEPAGGLRRERADRVRILGLGVRQSRAEPGPDLVEPDQVAGRPTITTIGDRLSDRLTRPSWAVPAATRSSTTAGLAPTVRVVIAALSRMMLTVAMSLTLWAAMPALLGWQPTTVVTGSMAPKINHGDVVSARPVPSSSLQPGMVLLVDDPDHRDRLRLHRLVRFNPDGSLVLRGDANPQDDSSPVDRKAVHGVGVLRVPYVATPILWLQQGAWLRLVMLVAVILALVAAAGLDRHLDPAEEPDHRPDPPEEPRT
jgi:signal peptidase I